MPRSEFQSGPATDHYHETLGVDETPATDLGSSPDLTPYQLASEKDQASGYAGLDSGGKLLAAQLPGAAATDVETAAAVAALSSVYQPLDSDLTAIAALATTSYGRAFLALADAAAGRTALGLGTASTQATGAFDAAGAAAAAQSASQPLDSDLTAIAALTTTSFGRGLLALADAAAVRATLSLVPGTNVASLTAGVVPIAQLATGTPTGAKFIRDDGVLAAPTAGLSPIYRGRNVIGGTRYAWPVSYAALARKITAGSTGDLLLSIQGYVDQSANNIGQMWTALWEDDAGTVGRLIGTGLTMSLFLGGTGGGVGAYPPRWFGPPIAATLLTASTAYWIGLVIDAGANGPGIYRDAGGHDVSMAQAGAYASDGERWTQTDTTYDLSIRALIVPL